MFDRPSPADLAAIFDRCLPDDPAVVRRKMFGWPAAFVGGRMFAGLHGDSMVVRLPEPRLATFLALDGARGFEPMPGRPMKGYAVVPDAMLSQEGDVRAWIQAAFDHVRTLPPK